MSLVMPAVKILNINSCGLIYSVKSLLILFPNSVSNFAHLGTSLARQKESDEV